MTGAPAKARILIVGDAVAPTGFARVIRSIFTPLSGTYELHQLATRYDGGAHDYLWPLHAAKAGKSVYGYDQLASLVERIQPSLVFVLYDISFQVQYLALLKQLVPCPKIVVYSPVEAGPIAPEMVQQLHGVTRYVMYTEYGRNEIEKSLQSVREQNPAFRFPALEVIPHGVDCDRFFPLDHNLDDASTSKRRRAARHALGFVDAGLLDAFIVLNANRNMPRKRIDITLQGFALFALDKPASVKLYLHMATEDSGWNVLILARRYRIYGRLIMTQADNSRPTFSDERMNLLYNACDVGITTTTGEGWGMVSFEHAATRTAQIVPRHTSLAELWAGAAEFVEPTTTLTYPGNLTVGHIVSPEGVAAALQRVYEDADYRASLAEMGYRNATRPEFNWSSIAAQWQGCFDEVIAGVVP